MIAARTAGVISTSWGECETELPATERNEEIEEAATYGETVYAAAGDSGAAGCGTHTAGVEDPASQPDVTGVGGDLAPRLPRSLRGDGVERRLDR